MEDSTLPILKSCISSIRSDRGSVISPDRYIEAHEAVDCMAFGVVEYGKCRGVVGTGRRKYSRSRKTEEKWREAGRGQGERNEYSPWLTGRDVPSRGGTYQPWGWHISRQYELLSKWEYYYFLHLEWAWVAHRRIWDIREQFPLQWVDDTVALAEKLGLSHGTDVASGDPQTMTTDFMVTL